MNKIVSSTINIIPDADVYKITKTEKKDYQKWNYNKQQYIRYDSKSIDNVPTTGLQLCSLNGNICVHDPRGFYIPVPAERFMDFIKNITIISGDIIGSYVYGWDKNKVNIIPSDKVELLGYKTNVQKIPAKHFDVGKVYNDYLNKEYVYLGKMTYITKLNMLHAKEYVSNLVSSNLKNTNIKNFIGNTNIVDFDVGNNSILGRTEDLFLSNNTIKVKGSKKHLPYTTTLCSNCT